MNPKTVCLPLACAAATGAVSSEAMAAQKRPNIVIIVADDLGWGDVGFHGSTIGTPNIDRIARSGIELNRYYVAPISSPTRSGLMTGRYPNRFGIREGVINPWKSIGLDLEERTIADMLGENGYVNRAIVGKWHLGHSRKAYYPLNRGFTHFYGHLNGAIDYFTHEREGELDWHNDWETCRDKGYSTDLIANEASRCIDRYAPGDDPFFLYVAFNAPHSPYQAPEEEIARHIALDKFAALPKREQSAWTFRAMVSRLDSGVGKILEALGKSGEMDNTIILFMSDNGGVNGMADGGSTNGQLHGHKGQEWDGGLRVAAAIWWEKGFMKGVRSEQVTGFVDILPTLADVAGAGKAPARPYDGISMKDVFSGKKASVARDMYLGCGAAVNSDFKLILKDKMKLQGDFLAHYPDDRYESANYIAKYPDESARLRKFVAAYDTITPPVNVKWGDGNQKSFVAPKDWKILND